MAIRWETASNGTQYPVYSGLELGEEERQYAITHAGRWHLTPRKMQKVLGQAPSAVWQRQEDGLSRLTVQQGESMRLLPVASTVQPVAAPSFIHSVLLPACLWLAVAVFIGVVLYYALGRTLSRHRNPFTR